MAMNYQALREIFPHVKSGVEILEMEFPPQEWLIDNMLPIGSALLAGPPKLGKSYFVLNLIQKILEKNFGVFYYAGEDDCRRIQSRMKQLRINSDKVAFHPGREASLVSVGQNISDAVRRAIEVCPDIKAIFIDTMTLILPRKSKVREYDDWVHDLKPWADLANDLGVNITMVHHTRKENNDADHNPYNSILGSQGIMASFDTIMIMKKASNGYGAVLNITGKDVEEKEYRLSKQEFGWEIEGLESIASLGETQTEVYFHIKAYPNQTWTQIKNALEIDGSQLSKTLEKLTFDNIIEKCDGEYNALV